MTSSLFAFHGDHEVSPFFLTFAPRLPVIPRTGYISRLSLAPNRNGARLLLAPGSRILLEPGRAQRGCSRLVAAQPFPFLTIRFQLSLVLDLGFVAS